MNPPKRNTEQLLEISDKQREIMAWRSRACQLDFGLGVAAARARPFANIDNLSALA
jgi:hypothetical protein